MVRKLERESDCNHYSLTEMDLRVSSCLYSSLSAAYFDIVCRGIGHRGK